MGKNYVIFWDSKAFFRSFSVPCNLLGIYNAKAKFNKLQAAYSSQSMDIFCLSDENYTGAALTVFWGEGGNKPQIKPVTVSSRKIQLILIP